MFRVVVLILSVSMAFGIRVRPPDDGITGPILDLRGSYKKIRKTIIGSNGVKIDLSKIEVPVEFIIERNSNIAYRYLDLKIFEKTATSGKILEFSSEGGRRFWIAKWDSIPYATKTYFTIKDDTLKLQTEYLNAEDTLRYKSKETILMWK